MITHLPPAEKILATVLMEFLDILQVRVDGSLPYAGEVVHRIDVGNATPVAPSTVSHAKEAPRLRYCIGFCTPYHISISQVAYYLLPIITETPAGLGGTHCLMSFDLASGYH